MHNGLANHQHLIYLNLIKAICVVNEMGFYGIR